MNSLLSPKTQKNEKPVNRASWLLPAYAYSDSNIYSQEIEKIFKKEWLYAAHVSSLRKPGDFLTLTLADQPLLVVCDKSNRIRTFYNICRHRGAAIASGSGNAETFSCPYHAWTYDCGGRLTTAPLMDQAVDFDPSKIRLREVRTEVFNGLVFINFDEAAPGLIDRITDLDAILKPWPIADMVPAYRYEMVGDFNWKLLLENGIEGYHIIAAHRQSFEDIAPAHLTYSTDNKGRYWSDLHTPYADYASVPVAPAIPGVPSWVRERMSFFILYPHFVMSVGEDSINTYISYPEGPKRTRFVWTMYVPETTTQWEGYSAFMSAYGPWIDMINVEDRGICESVQRGVESGSWILPRYSHLEEPVWQFHKWYLERMKLDPA